MSKNVRIIANANNKNLKTANIVTSGGLVYPTREQTVADDRTFKTVQDSGGTVQGLPTIIVPGYSSGGGGGYVAKAVHFDGLTQFLLDAYSGADSPFLSFSFWAKTTSAHQSNIFPWSFTESNPSNLSIGPNFANTSDFSVGIEAENAEETRFLTLDTPQDGSFPVWQDDAWINFIGAVDTNHVSGQKIFSTYLNDAPQTFTRYQDDDEFNMAFNGFHHHPKNRRNANFRISRSVDSTRSVH